MSVVVHHGDSRDVLKTLPDASVDSIVTDPPYALVSITKRFGADGAAPAKSDGATGAYARASAGFMGQRWDTGETAFDPTFWVEVLRVLKPGGHIIAASGTRTYHRLVCAIEDAGFDVGPGSFIRDTIINWIASDTHAARFLASLGEEQMRALLLAYDEAEFAGMFGWVFGSGFPKSHDVSKGIDKAAGAVRQVLSAGAAVKRMIPGADQNKAGWEKANGREYVPTVTAAATPEAAAWEGWGTALKPACEPWVLARKPLGKNTVAANVLAHGTGALNIDGCRVEGGGPNKTFDRVAGDRPRNQYRTGTGVNCRETDQGRWPANVIHDGSDEVADAFPEAPGQQRSTGPQFERKSNIYGEFAGVTAHEPRGDSGSAARFFYSAKADAHDRLGSGHPTVKPVDLMQYLCRLVTPPGGVVLDPFAGSGTTGEAAWREGFSAILIEREERFAADARRRIEWAQGRGRTTAIEKARLDRPGAAAKAKGDDLPLFGGEAA